MMPCSICFYLDMENIAKKGTIPVKIWNSALNQFSIMFEE